MLTEATRISSLKTVYVVRTASVADTSETSTLIGSLKLALELLATPNAPPVGARATEGFRSAAWVVLRTLISPPKTPLALTRRALTSRPAPETYRLEANTALPALSIATSGCDQDSEKPPWATISSGPSWVPEGE